MESSRKTYELATQRLVSFLDEVTAALQSTSPHHRKLVENTKAEVSKVARRARAHQKRFSMESSMSGVSLMSRAESMPGQYKCPLAHRVLFFNQSPLSFCFQSRFES